MSVLAKGQLPETTSTILAVEDNAGDRRLLEEAVLEAGGGIDLQTVEDGDAAVAFLRARIADGPASLPDLVLTDLHLPGRDGEAVLTAIREDLGLSDLPVVVLSRSERPADVTRCYRSGADAYLTKPDGFDELIALVESVDALWIDPATAPPPRTQSDLSAAVADVDEEAFSDAAILPPDERPV